MIPLFIIFGIGTGIAAFRVDGGGRWFLAACSALNLLGAAHAISTGDKRLWRLQDNPCNGYVVCPDDEPGYRP